MLKFRSYRFIQVTLLVLTIIALIWFASQVLYIFRNNSFSDFDILFHSALKLTIGQSPYDIEGLRLAPFGPYYKFPPLVDIILAQLSGLNLNLKIIQVAQIYAALGLVLYLLTFFLLVRMESLRFGSIPFFLLAIAFLVFQPSLDTLAGAQHEFVILMFCTLAYWGLKHGRIGEWVTGASIGIITLIKIYPILFMAYFFLRRYWNAAISLVCTIIALTLVSILLAGWELQAQFWFGIFPALSGGTAWLENQSIFGFLARLFVNGATVDPDLATPLPLAAMLNNLATILTLSLSLWALWRSARPEFAFVILIPLMLLISPNAWIHYETLLLLPLAILLSNFSKKANG